MYAKHLIRQFDLIPAESLQTPITVIGAGAIGGWTVLSLAKMGYANITVYDNDTVDIENMNSQLYRFKDIGKKKVHALQEIVKDFTDIEIKVVDGLYPLKDNITMTSIVISAVDSMKSRSGIWGANKMNGFVKYFIDPRMGSETALLYVMQPNDKKDIDSYEKTLYTDANAVAEPCTRKSTQYCALALSGLVCAQVKAITTGNNYSRSTQWDIPKGGFMQWTKEMVNE